MFPGRAGGEDSGNGAIPAIFKARLLSKSWLARFQPISYLYDKEEKLLAAEFQKQVLERSKNWQTFYPVCITEEDLFAYNLGSRNWQKLPPLRFLPMELSLSWRIGLDRYGLCQAKKNLYIDGAFLYGNSLSNSKSDSCLMGPGYFVANILTQKWRRLPLPPLYNMPGSAIRVTGMKLVNDASSETYKLILSCQDGRESRPHFAQIYDSKSGIWSRKDFVLSVGSSTPPSTFASLKAVHYGLSFNNLESLATFNLEDGTMEERIVPSTLASTIGNLTGSIFIVPDDEEFDTVTLMVRNGSLLLVVTVSQDKSVFLFEIEVESRRWRELDWCLPGDFEEEMIDIRHNEDNSIFVELDESNAVMVVYDKHEDKWRFCNFPKMDYQWTACSFQPGLNAFTEV